MRIVLPGRGKGWGLCFVTVSGEDIPVFLLTVFAKNEKANLNARERTALVATAKKMVAEYRRDE